MPKLSGSTSIKCELCAVTVSSQEQYESHVHGKKHQKNKALKKSKKSSAKASIYITGFNRDTTQEQIRQIFIKFGKIKNFFMNKDKGFFCILEYHDKKHAEHALNSGPFLVGRNRRPLIVKSREVKAPVPPVKDPELKAKKKEAKEKIASAEAQKHAELLKKLCECRDVGHQMDKLQTELQLKDAGSTLRKNIVQKIQEVIQAYIPAAKVQQFGSSITGFGLEGCDLDATLDLNLDKAQQYSSVFANVPPKREVPYIGNLKSVKVKHGRIDLESLKTTPPADLTQLIARLLGVANEGFIDIFAIHAARIPVIKFTHKGSGTKCDLSINNKLPLYNTRLIQYFAGLDPRVRPLVFTIRYWAKCMEVGGSGGVGAKLTNYAIMNLIFYYLQTLDPPVLPSVHTLSGLAESYEQNEVDGWDCSFTTATSKWRKQTNKASLVAMLKGFFQFFSSFDLGSSVFCPRLGQAVGIPEFREVMESVHKMQNFRIGSLQIQDPFVLDHNIAANVNEQIKSQLVDAIKVAHEKCQHQDFEARLLGTNWGIADLLMTEASEEALATMSEGTDHMLPTTAGDMVHLKHSMVLQMRARDLSSALLESAKSHEQLKLAWLERVLSLVRQVLTDVMYCKTWDLPIDEPRTKDLRLIRLPRATICTQTLEEDFPDDVPMETEEEGEVEKSSEDKEEKMEGACALPEKPSDTKKGAAPDAKKGAAAPMEKGAEKPGKDGGDVKDAATMDEPSEGTSKDRQTWINPTSWPTIVHAEPMDVEPTKNEEYLEALKHGPPHALKLRMECQCKWNMWSGRKYYKRDLLNEGFTPGLQLEAQISRMIAMDTYMSSIPLGNFDVSVLDDSVQTHTALRVCVEPHVRSGPEFQSVSAIFFSILSKVMEKDV